MIKGKCNLNLGKKGQAIACMSWTWIVSKLLAETATGGVLKNVFWTVSQIS